MAKDFAFRAGIPPKGYDNIKTPEDREQVRQKLLNKANWHIARAGSRTSSHVAAGEYLEAADRLRPLSYKDHKE